MVQAFKGGIGFLIENSLFLLFGAAAALLAANFWPQWYSDVQHQMYFTVNEILMAFFFGIAIKEVTRAFLPGGDLDTFGKAVTPVVATAGGVIGPAGLYAIGVLLLDIPDAMTGWAVPTATDIAFAYLVGRWIFGKGSAATVFLLTLAIVDDLVGMAIIAVFYSDGGDYISMLIFVGIGMTWAFGCRLMKLQSFWWYLIGSIPVWWGLHEGGVHPALALAFAVPFMPYNNGKKAPHDEHVYEEMRYEEGHETDTMSSFEHFFKNPVELILGFFGFVNAGIFINPDIFTEPVTWLITSALLIGKPLGIIAFGGIGLLLGLKLPKGMSMHTLTVLGVIAGIGFTVALFVSTVAFPAGLMQDAAKMGALLSFGAAPLAFLLARVLRYCLLHERNLGIQPAE